MEIRKLEPRDVSLRGAVELADVALDAFRDDPMYLALHMHYGGPNYARQKLSYGLVLASKLWRSDVRAWIAVKDGRVLGFCRWENLDESEHKVCGVWVWAAELLRWLVDLYALVVEPPALRPVGRKVMATYFSSVGAYFQEVAPVPQHAAYLGLLCARLSCQGQGVGSALLDASMKDIAASSPRIPSFSLWATAAGLGLYKKHGFVVRAEHNASFNGKQQRQILMTKL